MSLDLEDAFPKFVQVSYSYQRNILEKSYFKDSCSSRGHNYWGKLGCRCIKAVGQSKLLSHRLIGDKLAESRE